MCGEREEGASSSLPSPCRQAGRLPHIGFVLMLPWTEYKQEQVSVLLQKDLGMGTRVENIRYGMFSCCLLFLD